MSHPRFTVVPGEGYNNKLTELWLRDREVVQEVQDKLDRVLQVIPLQAGIPFEYEGQSYRFVRYRGYQVVYQIESDDCRVTLLDICTIT